MLIYSGSRDHVEELEEFKDGEKEVRSAVDDFDSKTCFIGTRNKYLRSLYIPGVDNIKNSIH